MYDGDDAVRGDKFLIPQPSCLGVTHSRARIAALDFRFRAFRR